MAVRLELAGFTPARLAWYKAQGCFTDIIRYRTLVPVDRAAAVLARMTFRDAASTQCAVG